MARQKDEDRRQAILTAAMSLIASDGLGAATSAIAKQAGVPHGSVFTYFATKNELFNELYVELKRELLADVLKDMPISADGRARLYHLWSQWTRWGARHPLKRRALAQLGVSDVVSHHTKASARQEAEPVMAIIREISSKGVLAGRSITYIGAMVETLADTTMDFMISEPEQLEQYSAAGFESLWRALA